VGFPMHLPPGFPLCLPSMLLLASGHRKWSIRVGTGVNSPLHRGVAPGGGLEVRGDFSQLLLH
jgi:hypothetical protein